MSKSGYRSASEVRSLSTLNASEIRVDMDDGHERILDTQPMSFRKKLIRPVEGGRFVPEVKDQLVEDASNLLNSMHDEMYSVKKRRPNTAATSSIMDTSAVASSTTKESSSALGRPPSSRVLLPPHHQRDSLMKVRDVVGPRRSSLDLQNHLSQNTSDMSAGSNLVQSYQPTLQAHCGSRPASSSSVKLRHAFPHLKANVKRTGSAQPASQQGSKVLLDPPIDASVHPGHDREDLQNTVGEMVNDRLQRRGSNTTRQLVPIQNSSRGASEEALTVCGEDGTVAKPSPPQVGDWKAIIQSGATSRDFVKERSKTLEWLKYWGDVHKLREAGVLLNERLGAVESDNMRLEDKIAWLEEQLTNSEAEGRNILMLYKGADLTHGRMMVIERERFNSLQSENERLSSLLGDIRRRLVSAEAATERMALDLQETEDRAERLEKELNRSYDSHSVEMYKLKTEFQAKVDGYKSLQSLLETTTAAATTAREKLMAQDRTVELLQGDIKSLNEKLTAAQQQGGSAFLRKFGTQLDQSTVQQLLKFSRTQGDVVERIASLTDDKKAAVNSKRIILDQYERYSRATESTLMELHDIDSVSRLSFKAMMKMKGSGGQKHRGPSRNALSEEGASSGNFDEVATMKKLVGREVEGAIGRKIAKSPFLPAINEYRSIFFDEGLPKLAQGMQQVVQHVWKAHCEIVPPELREGLYKEMRRLVVEKVEAPLKDIARAHVSALDTFSTIEDEVANKKVDESIARSHQGPDKSDALERRVREANATIEAMKGEVEASKRATAFSAKLSALARKLLEEMVEKTQFELGVVPPPGYTAIPISLESLGTATEDNAQAVSTLEKGISAVDSFCAAVRFDYRQRRKATEQLKPGMSPAQSAEDRHEEAQRALRLEIASKEKIIRELGDKLEDARKEVKGMQAHQALAVATAATLAAANRPTFELNPKVLGKDASSNPGSSSEKKISIGGAKTKTPPPQSSTSKNGIHSSGTTKSILVSATPILGATEGTTRTTIPHSAPNPSSQVAGMQLQANHREERATEERSVQCSIMSLKGWIKRIPLSMASSQAHSNYAASYRGALSSSPKRGSRSLSVHSLFQEPYKMPVPFDEERVSPVSRSGSLFAQNTATYRLDAAWENNLPDRGSAAVSRIHSSPTRKSSSEGPTSPGAISLLHRVPSTDQVRSPDAQPLRGNVSPPPGVLSRTTSPSPQAHHEGIADHKMEDARRRAAEARFNVARSDPKSVVSQADSLMAQLLQRRGGGGGGERNYLRGASAGRSKSNRPASPQPSRPYQSPTSDRFSSLAAPSPKSSGSGFLYVTPLH